MIKYKVVDRRISYIPDIWASYRNKGNDPKAVGGVRQALSATYNDYLLIDEYADQESFEVSLKSGILRKFIDQGLIVEEDVESKKVNKLATVLASNPFERKSVKSMEAEEAAANKKAEVPEVVDSKVEIPKIVVSKPLAELSTSELLKLLKDAKKKDKAIEEEKMQKRVTNNFPNLIANSNEKELDEHSIEVNEDIDDTESIDWEEKQEVKEAPKKEPIFISAKTPTTIEEFSKLKYQEGLHAISVITDIGLLTLIAQNAKQNLTKNRAIQRLEILKRG